MIATSAIGFWQVLALLLMWVPLLGAAVYLVFRLPTATRNRDVPAPQADRRFHWQCSAPTPTTLHALQVLSDLHDAGKLTDAEFAEQKRKILAA
jgi:hypothetical protein